MEITNISPILTPNSRRFDDSEGSRDDEEDWMHRFIVFTNTEKHVITEYDLNRSLFIEKYEKLIKLWQELGNNVIYL